MGGDNPGWSDLERGLNRAWWWVPRWRTEEQGGGFGPAQRPGAEMPTPSRQTMIGISRLQAPPNNKAARRALEEGLADTAAETYRARPGGSTNRSEEAPTDPPEPKAGTGASASAMPTVDAEGKPIESDYGQYRIVRMPNGKIIVTAGGGEELASQGGVPDPEGAKANVVSGPAGTVYSSPENLLVGEGANLADVNPPYGADRSPGWAARTAFNEAYRAGDLSMDPLDVADRRRFEEQEMLRDQAIRDAEVEAAMKEVGLIQAEKAAAMDPYAMAEIEAQGKYGGAMIQENAQAARQAQAMAWFLDTTRRIRAMEEQLQGLDPQSAQAQALRQALDRAVQERREIANIAMGFRINDPRQADAFTAMLTLLGGGMGAGAGGETGG